MKKIYLILVLIIVVVTGCTDKFGDYNTDQKNPATVPGEALFANAEKELSDYINNTNVNVNIYKLISQYWTETTYTDEANYDLITRNISSNVYSRLYLRVLNDLNESAKLIDSTKIEAPAIADKKVAKQNKLQIIEILNVYVYSHLVDIFGNIPYSQSLDIDNVYPKYDDAATIYKDLFKRLDAALSKLELVGDDEAGLYGLGSSDFIYGGDIASWKKFANALKIKLAITIADYDNTTAKAAVESAVAGTFESNDDDALFPYVQASPNYNQLYADLVASGRHDFVAANTIVDIMNGLDDPRRDAYFSFKVDTSTVAGVEKYAYVGGIYGYQSSYSLYSHISAKIQKPDFPGILLTYSELAFYLAEAAERGYNVGKTAEEWYNEGVKSSFTFWGVNNVESYLARPDVAYTTATGTWRQKIALQSWIASYTRGEVGYNTWRRLDYPIFNLPEYLSEDESGLTPADAYKEIPVRFTYPVEEQTLNTDQYNAASTAIGGDLVTTKLFWDKY